MKSNLIVIIFIAFSCAFSQSNPNKCNVEVEDVSELNSFGYLLGYTVTFKNNSKKTVDGIWWKASFYNNADELIKEKNYSFNSDNLIDPIGVGFTKSIVRSPRVRGASIVKIKITKVHYSDDSLCD